MTGWFILPGMGASSNMYNSLEKELGFDVHLINWPKYQNEITYKEIADRIIAENQIRETDIIAGSSLGGMIALEIFTLLNTKSVVLMGSAISKNEINKLLSLFTPFTSITPISFIQTLSGKNENIISQMFADSDPDFIRAMCKYISSWPGYKGATDKVYRIHGKKDHIITCPKSGCDVIKDAGHLLAITHAKECAIFIEKVNSHLTSR
jgi:hypothetical protein